MNGLLGPPRHLDQVLVVAIGVVIQVVLAFELREREGRVHQRRVEVATWIPQQPVADATRALGAEACFHLDAMPKKVLS